MKQTAILIKRNIKLFFKDKGMFFTSLITPLILLVLYATFLGNVYKDSFMMVMPEGLKVAEKLIDGCVGGQLVSSILAVSCVTVAFCANFLMVSDKATGNIKDLKISPVKDSTFALSYYFATLISTLVICFSAAVICLVYVANIGWYMSVMDVFCLFLDIFLLVMFGTALSSCINFFLSSQGQISAVGSIVSSCYGFICGAYMPMSQFSEGLQKLLSFLPSTYATALIRNHCLRGVFAAMEDEGIPSEVIKGFGDTVDCNVKFFDETVGTDAMYIYLAVSVVVLVAVYVVMNILKNRKAR